MARGSQFSLKDVEVVVATVDLEEVRGFRTSKSRAMQAKNTEKFQRIEADLSLSKNPADVDPLIGPTPEVRTAPTRWKTNHSYRLFY